MIIKHRFLILPDQQSRFWYPRDSTSLFSFTDSQVAPQTTAISAVSLDHIWRKGGGLGEASYLLQSLYESSFYTTQNDEFLHRISYCGSYLATSLHSLPRKKDFYLFLFITPFFFGS